MIGGIYEKDYKLRGYSSDDPCKKIPEGHDPEMWEEYFPLVVFTSI
jgi:hypothetical protein